MEKVKVVVWTEEDYKEGQEMTVYVAIEKDFLAKLEGFEDRKPKLEAAGELLFPCWGYEVPTKHGEVFKELGLSRSDFRYRVFTVTSKQELEEKVEEYLRNIEEMKEWLESRETIKKFSRVYFV